MKRLFGVALCLVLLCGCVGPMPQEEAQPLYASAREGAFRVTLSAEQCVFEQAELTADPFDVTLRVEYLAHQGEISIGYSPSNNRIELLDAGGEPVVQGLPFVGVKGEAAAIEYVMLQAGQPYEMTWTGREAYVYSGGLEAGEYTVRATVDFASPFDDVEFELSLPLTIEETPSAK